MVSKTFITLAFGFVTLFTLPNTSHEKYLLVQLDGATSNDEGPILPEEAPNPVTENPILPEGAPNPVTEEGASEDYANYDYAAAGSSN